MPRLIKMLGRVRRDADQLERADLRARIQRLLDRWQPRLGVRVRSWNLRTMKNYWGSTNAKTREITFNSRLAELPPSQLEITVVHELMHLLEAPHSPRFYALMDRHVPGWRRIEALYAGPMSLHS